MAFYNSRSDNEDFSDFEGVSTSRTVTPLEQMPQEGWEDSGSIMSGMSSQDADWYEDQMTLNGQFTYREDNPGTLNQVPPLDLRSEMNFSMDSLPEMITHHAKLDQSAKAKQNTTYELWLQKKREKQAQEAARKKKEEQRKEDEINARKQLAEKKYQVWLAKKRQETDFRPPTASPAAPVSNSAVSPTASSSNTSSQSQLQSKSPAPSPSPSAAPSAAVTTRSSNYSQVDRNSEKQRKIEAWERTKREQAEKLKMKKKREEEEKKLLEQKRKEESQAAYNRWQKSNKNRPKPVPMNQGMLSLRGTISDIYINPNEWQSILD